MRARPKSRITHVLNGSKSRRRCIVAGALLALSVILVACCLLMTKRLPPAVAVVEPTKAQRAHTAQEQELNAQLMEQLEKKGLGQEVARLRENPLRFRVFTIETRLNTDLCQMAATAALVGVHVPVVAHDRKPGYIKRFEYMLEYIAEERLAEDDILFVHDSDTFYVGEDLLPHIQEFALHSPPTPEKLDVAAVRAYDDFGEFLAPEVLLRTRGTPLGTHTYHAAPTRFAQSFSCMFWSSVPEKDCKTVTSYVQALIEAVRNRNETTVNLDTQLGRAVPKNSPLVSYINTQLARGSTIFDALNNFNGNAENQTNSAPSHIAYPSRDPTIGDDARLRFFPNIHEQLAPGFLNAGVFMTRVWSFRRLVAAIHTFENTHTPFHTQQAEGIHWWCDQSIIGTLFALTRAWEAEQGLLASPPPTQRPLFMENPNGLLPGMLGVETYARTVILLMPSPTKDYAQWNRFLTRNTRRGNRQILATTPDPGLAGNEDVYKSGLRRTRTGAFLAPPMWRTTPGFREDLQETPIDYCAVPYRCPIMLHFPGGDKSKRMNTLFPKTEVMLPALADPEAADVMRSILNEAVIEFHTQKGRVYRRFYDVCDSPK